MLVLVIVVVKNNTDVFGWVFSFILLGSQHVLRAHMGVRCTRGEPTGIELAAAHRFVYRLFLLFTALRCFVLLFNTAGPSGQGGGVAGGALSSRPAPPLAPFPYATPTHCIKGYSTRDNVNVI